MTTILVVDDEASWRALLRRVLEVDGYTVALATDGEEALAMVRAARPALVLLDDLLPGLSGVEVCARLRQEERGEPVPIIMLTVQRDVPSRIAALEAGADDHVVKPCDFDELRARVRARLRRRPPLPPPPNDSTLQLDLLNRQIKVHGQPLNFSPREFDLFARLWREAGRLVSRETIAREVWGGTCAPDDNVIEVYVGRLRRKLRAAGYGGCIRTRWGGGYLLELPSAAS
jgi:DNA-binding response OmpR family regulator